MCQSCVPRIPSDMGKAEAFAGQMIATINQGAISTMISIGHRTRLFDVLDQLPPATSEAIAASAGLQERYVREWLGAMVCAGIITYEPKGKCYELPPEHALFLTRKAREKNLAAIAQFLPVWAQVEDQIVNCFEHGGGVAYDQYERFHEVMGENTAANVGENLIEKILPGFPELTARLEAGIRVLDIGCGRGDVLMTLAHQYPKSQFLGIDLCEEPIEQARRQVQRSGLGNLQFVTEDLTRFSPDGNFDLITAFDVIHDLARPQMVLNLTRNWLKPSGHFFMMDINASSNLEQNLENPLAPFLYTASTLHCMTVSLAQRGRGLGTVWGREKATEMLKLAGFERIDIRNYEHDMLNNYYCCS